MMAAWIGVDRPRLSELRRGIVKRYSLEMLIRFLARLRYDVTLSVSRRRIVRRPR
jgi:predicted XRE-type DNA-binding protein